jgi:3-deoxy-D-manno-octulosonic-acid transferase
MLIRIKPEILIVIETELWPNLFRVFKEKDIPIVVLNGRISKKSFQGYKKISFFMKRVLSSVDFFGMQNDLYVQRIQGLGVHAGKVLNTGNFKFDTKPPSKISAWAENIRGQILIAGSTHEGEEELITSAYLELKKEFPDLNLILAPRHPERFRSVEDLLKEKGILYIKRSSLGNHQLSASTSLHSGEKTESGMVILLDTVGELSSVYGISDIAIMGKSFRGHGGQNPLEPAYWGKAIICGPHMENFPVIQDFYKAEAAIMAHENELFSTVKKFLLAPEKAREIGLRAQEIYRKNAGTVEKALRIIEKFVPR